MSILVVGGAGYIGSQLTEELVYGGDKVKVLDRGYFGFESIKHLKEGIELVSADMRNVPSSLFDGVRVVVNVGGLSNDPTAEYSPVANHEMNVTASYELARAAKDAGVKKYVLASSCSIYDRGLVDESADVLLEEGAEVNPQAAYGKSKLDAESAIFPLQSKEFKVVALRKGTVFGVSSRMRWDLVVNTMVKAGFLKGALQLNYNGQMWRPMVHIQDAVHAYYMAALSDMDGIYNVASFNIRVSEIAVIVANELQERGYPCKIESNDLAEGIRSYRVSSEKIRSLGWKSKCTLREAVNDIIEYIVTMNNQDLEWDNPVNYNIKWMKTIDACALALGIDRKSYECI